MSLLQNEGIELCPQPWRSGLLKRASQAPEKARQDPKAVKTIKLKAPRRESHGEKVVCWWALGSLWAPSSTI